MELEDIIDDKKSRIEAGRHSFWFWFQYHYWWKSKKFTKDRADSLQAEGNTFIEAFRASRKTTLVRWFVCWCIAYKIEPSIIRQSYEDKLSGESVREIAKMLFNPTVIADHGYLFPMSNKREDLEKSSMTNFESTTWVKVAAKSMGQTIRGTNTFDLATWISARPTLLILDDIDVVKSVNNIDIINANEKKILGETIPALDPLRRKIIFLGNTINEDGIVPRFRNRYKKAKSWRAFRQPLRDQNGNNVWPEVFTEKVINEIMEDGKTSVDQNYRLIPSTAGNWVFVRAYFDTFLLSHFEDPDSPLKKTDVTWAIFIDPAFSTDAASDDAVVVWGWEHKITKKFYVPDGYADTSAPSKTINAVIVMYNNMVANGLIPAFISVENVYINKKQVQFIKDLKDALIEAGINCPIHLYEPRANKNARIKDNLESVMSQQWIKWNKSMPDKTFINKIETQFLEYPNGDHDDVIDTLSQMVDVFRSKRKKDTPTNTQQRTYIDPRTGQRKVIWDPNVLTLNKQTDGITNKPRQNAFGSSQWWPTRG